MKLYEEEKKYLPVPVSKENFYSKLESLALKLPITVAARSKA
jgi:hypothetical protein